MTDPIATPSSLLDRLRSSAASAGAEGHMVWADLMDEAARALEVADEEAHIRYQSGYQDGYEDCTMATHDD